MFPSFSKKSFIALIATVTLTSPLQLNVSANSKDGEEKISSKEVQIGDLDVTVYEDGRVKGLGKSKKLSNKNRKQVLKLMRFTEEEIDSLPEELQNELVSEGGVKVDSKVEDFVHIYTDLDGNDHEVTEENKKEIEKIKKRDYKKIQEMSAKGKVIAAGTDLGSETDGDFTGTGHIIYRGIEGNEYGYMYYTKFEWSDRPALYFTDTLGHTWQNHTTSIGSASDYDVRYFNGNGDPLGTIDFEPELDNSDVLGTKGEFDIDYHAGVHYGYIRDRVRIPRTEKGNTGQFASAYAHSWSNANMELAFRYISIDISGLGDKWSWKNSFEIGTEKEVN